MGLSLYLGSSAFSTAQYTNGWETDIIRNFLNGGPISWFSRLQKLVALSTAESETYAAIDGVKIIAHLKILLNELSENAINYSLQNNWENYFNKLDSIIEDKYKDLN